MSKKKPKILILFYSMYGHIFEMAKHVVKGVKKAGGEPVLMVVPELMPEKFWDENVKKIKKAMKNIPVADPRKDLDGINGLIVGTPTRFGNMCAQMRNFFDQTAGTWMKGGLISKPAAVFTSSNTQHGGQETTIIATHITLLHQGCVIVGLPYSFPGQMTQKEISGGSPYGASTIAGDGPPYKKMPTKNELKLASELGGHLTGIAKKLM